VKSASRLFVLTPPRVTARIVNLTWLGCPTDDAADELARLAIELVKDRDSWRALALAASGRRSRTNGAVARPSPAATRPLKTTRARRPSEGGRAQMARGRRQS
jgi:hypothetical protein